MPGTRPWTGPEKSSAPQRRLPAGGLSGPPNAQSGDKRHFLTLQDVLTPGWIMPGAQASRSLL